MYLQPLCEAWHRELKPGASRYQKAGVTFSHMEPTYYPWHTYHGKLQKMSTITTQQQRAIFEIDSFAICTYLVITEYPESRDFVNYLFLSRSYLQKRDDGLLVIIRLFGAITVHVLYGWSLLPYVLTNHHSVPDTHSGWVKHVQTTSGACALRRLQAGIMTR